MRLAVFEIAGVWALAISGAYVYASQMSQKYAIYVYADSDLTELLQARLDAVAGYAYLYSGPVCLIMVLMFFMRTRSHGTWLVTVLLVCSSLLILIITDALVDNAVLDL